MTSECAVKGCQRRSVHIARVVARPGNPYAKNVIKDEIIERLANGEAVPLCPEHYAWCVEVAGDLVRS